MVAIREIGAASFDERALLELLRDAVDEGASVGYLAPLPDADGRAFWHAVKSALADGRVLFGAYVDDRLVGAVQLDPVPKPNGRHRAEVQKLLVLRAFRGRGIAKALMAAVERQGGRARPVAARPRHGVRPAGGEALRAPRLPARGSRTGLCGKIGRRI